MSHDRRSVLAALGLALPFGLGARAATPAAPPGRPPVLRLRSFEDAVREAFADAPFDSLPCRRVEVGYSDLFQAGVQGCHNDRPFAGFPAGHLRIVRVGSEPGSVVGGVRLFVSTVDVVWTGGHDCGPSRPLDFSALPPAPFLARAEAEPEGERHAPGRGAH